MKKPEKQTVMTTVHLPGFYPSVTQLTAVSYLSDQPIIHRGTLDNISHSIFS